MIEEDFSTYYSDDGNRSACIIRFDNKFKVVFYDKKTSFKSFLYAYSIEDAENKAEDFVMYESR